MDVRARDRLLIVALCYVVFIPVLVCVLPVVEIACAWFAPAAFFAIAAFCFGVSVAYGVLLCWSFGYRLDTTAPLGRYCLFAFPFTLAALFCASIFIHALGGPHLLKDLLDAGK